nr:hypothetical protein [Tanacetum cinerariifolium]
NLQHALELSLKEQVERTQGPARPVVIKEPNFGRIQPLPEAGSNAGDAAGSQTQPSHVVPAIPNLEPMDLEATDASPLQNPEELFFVKKQREEEPGKTNAEAKVQSMVSVPIHQDSSSVPPMTTLVIDLMTSQSGSPLSTSSATTSTVMMITTTPPPPHQPQQSTADPTLMKRIDELEQQMENLLQYNLALEERLDKHGSRLYKLENLNIPHQIWRKLVRRKEKDVTYQELSLGRHRHNNTSPSSSWCIWCSRLHLTADMSQLASLRLKSYLLWTLRSKMIPFVTSRYTYPMMKTPGMITYQKLIQEKTSGNHYIKRKDQRHLNLIRPFLLPIDIMNFLNWYCRQVNKTKLTEADLEGHAYEVVKAFYPNVIHLQFQMEEYIEYLRHRSKISSHALSISKMKAVSYPKFGLELLIPEQMWIEDVCTYDISAKIKAYSRYGYDYLSEIFLRRADLQEHMIAEKDFKNLHPSNFEDLNLLLLQAQAKGNGNGNNRCSVTTIEDSVISLRTAKSDQGKRMLLIFRHNELKAERLAKIQDPLALMVNSNNPYASPAPLRNQVAQNPRVLNIGNQNGLIGVQGNGRPSTV